MRSRPVSISTLTADHGGGLRVPCAAAGTVSVVFLSPMSPGDKSEVAGGGIPPERGREKGKGARRVCIFCAAAFPRSFSLHARCSLSGFPSYKKTKKNPKEGEREKKRLLRPCCSLPGARGDAAGRDT